MEFDLKKYSFENINLFDQGFLDHYHPVSQSIIKANSNIESREHYYQSSLVYGEEARSDEVGKQIERRVVNFQPEIIIVDHFNSHHEIKKKPSLSRQYSIKLEMSVDGWVISYASV